MWAEPCSNEQNSVTHQVWPHSLPLFTHFHIYEALHQIYILLTTPKIPAAKHNTRNQLIQIQKPFHTLGFCQNAQLLLKGKHTVTPPEMFAGL